MTTRRRTLRLRTKVSVQVCAGTSRWTRASCVKLCSTLDEDGEDGAEPTGDYDEDDDDEEDEEDEEGEEGAEVRLGYGFYGHGEASSTETANAKANFMS